MKVNVLSIEGAAIREIELSPSFEEMVRPDLIRKAVNTFRANRRQPYGASPKAGKQVAESFGVGRGIARVPRLSSGTAAFAPGMRKGRRAHPPRAEKIWAEKINKKENARALASALSATTKKDLVIARGHVFSDKVKLPIVVEDAAEGIRTTKELIECFDKLKVLGDVQAAKADSHIRAGKGKARGRKYKTPKSVLIVVSKKSGIEKAAANISGVDLVDAHNLNVEHLAPGGDAGRLTIFTEKALAVLAERTNAPRRR